MSAKAKFCSSNTGVSGTTTRPDAPHNFASCFICFLCTVWYGTVYSLLPCVHLSLSSSIGDNSQQPITQVGDNLRTPTPRKNKFSFKISRSLGRDYASNADNKQFDRYIHSADVRWNALMSGLRVLIVLGTVPDLFEMFNSTIGTFHTCAGTLPRSSWLGKGC